MIRIFCITAILCLIQGPPAAGQTPRTPAEAVDAFHAALSADDVSAALSLLARDVVVYEYGVVDPTLEAYAFQHLPADIMMAERTSWTLQTRQVGGTGDLHYVLSTYRVTGISEDGAPLDYITMETIVLRRTGDQFRIVHLHWSTNLAG